MTNREYLEARLTPYGVTSTEIDLIMAENPNLSATEIDGDGNEISIFDIDVCMLAIYNWLSGIIGTVSTNQYYKNWDIVGLKSYYNALCIELDKPSVTQQLTNLEALLGSANYPVDDTKLRKILLDNGIIDFAIYTGVTRQFELATAALYVLLITSANIAEGGYNISMTDKSNMLKLATGIYDKYRIPNPLKPKIKDQSNIW